MLLGLKGKALLDQFKSIKGKLLKGHAHRVWGSLQKLKSYCNLVRSSIVQNIFSIQTCSMILLK